MLIVYTSRTNNIERFVNNLKIINTWKLTPENKSVLLNEDFCLVTYTDGFGAVPELVNNFLSNNYKHLKAVVASGNRNFGNNFANAADLIQEKYQVPILLKFELSGTKEDRINFITNLNSMINIEKKNK